MTHGQFDFPAQLDNTVLAARSDGSHASYQARDFLWHDAREVTFEPPVSYLEMTGMKAEGRYVLPHFTSLVPQGNLRFFPASHMFYSRWQGDLQKSFLCILDIPRLTGWDISPSIEQLRSTINLRNDYVTSLVRRAYAEVMAPGFCNHLVLDSISVALAAEMLQLCSTRPVPRERGSKFDQRHLDTLAARIRDSRCKPTLEELAHETGLSPRQYARLFRAAAGESVASFCSRQLLSQAMELLADRSLLVKEVAFRCGFADTASFSKAFRKAAGASPQQYRQSLNH